MKVRKKRNTGRARSTTSKAHCFSPRGSEAEEIVRAIGEGEVDALVVVDGDEERVVTLASFGAVSELNEVVRAIRSGEVDAFLLSDAGQERVYTLAAIENALRESESRFRELAELMPCIVFTASPAGKPDYFNSPWWSFIQGDRHDPSCYDLGCVLHPVECERYRELWKLCVAEGMTCEIELEFTGPADAAPRTAAAGTPIDSNTMISMINPAPGTPAEPIEASVAVKTIINCCVKVNSIPNACAINTAATPW